MKKTHNQHLATKIVQKVHAFLQTRGVSKLHCHAQLTAKSFYDYLGYELPGSIFLEGGIKHDAIVKRLD